ncbi:MAG: hypothetical protein OXL98_12555 [Acidimicrobiaceae bacterium]|nr:hypothetical protein [Acidimicrobiaceae bacterium]
MLRERGSSWRKPDRPCSRDTFTQTDPEAEAVRLDGRADGCEPDTKLRDFDNAPLKQDIDAYN